MTSPALRPPLLATERKCIAPLLLLFVGACFYLLRATDAFRSIPGDLGDARFNSVILEHLYQWGRGESASLWSPEFFYPTRGTLAFSDNHLGSGVFYVLFRLLTLDREHAFDAWFVAGHVLNFAAMHVVMRRLRFAPFPAAVAAFIFAFALPVLAQEGHAQLTYRFPLPLAYLAFLEFAQERRVQQMARLAAWGALQFFCSIYLGVFLAYLLAATGLAMLLPFLRPNRPLAIRAQVPASRAAVLGAGLAITASAAATAGLLVKYQLVSRAYGFSRTATDVMFMMPRPQSYLLADSAQPHRWLGSLLAEIPYRHEHQMFFGLMPLLLGACALIMARRQENAPRRKLLGQALIALLLLVVLTLRIGDRTLYQFALALPGVSSIRGVSRIILVMTIPLAISAAIGVESLLKVLPGRRLAAIVIGLGLSLETLAYRPATTPVEQWQGRLTPLDEAVAAAPPAADSVLYVTGREQEPYFLTEMDAMIFAQDRKLPSLNGYSGNAPPGYLHPSACTSPAVRIHSLAPSILAGRSLTMDEVLARTRWIALDKCPLQHVSVDAAATSPDETQAKSIALDASQTTVRPDELQVRLRIRNNGRSTLHTLSRVGTPLRISWRFVPLPGSSDASTPGWDARHDANLSIPPGAEEDLQIALRLPEKPGTYDLQFSIVAEGYRWLHELGMPIAHLRAVVASEQPVRR